MKVILNKDLATLGEEGDVKDVAKGYARNFLFPRGIALPYNERTQKLFEERRGEIEERKALKRQDAAGLKEKLEALSLVLVMPAGQNGKLYGAVTSQTIMDELAKNSFQIERKRIEIPGNSIKSIGKYKINIRLYENSSAECSITVEGQPVKTETKTSALPPRRGRRDNQQKTEGHFAAASAEVQNSETASVNAVSPVPAAESTVAETPAAAVPAAAEATSLDSSSTAE